MLSMILCSFAKNINLLKLITQLCVYKIFSLYLSLSYSRIPFFVATKNSKNRYTVLLIWVKPATEQDVMLLSSNVYVIDELGVTSETLSPVSRPSHVRSLPESSSSSENRRTNGFPLFPNLFPLLSSSSSSVDSANELISFGGS